MAEPTAGAWPQPLVDEIGRLERWFEGRFATEVTSSDEAIDAERLLDTDELRAAIAAAGSMHASDASWDGDGEPGVDLRIAVSRLSRHYAAAVSVPALVGLAHGVGLDLSPGRCRLLVRHNTPFTLVLDASPEEVVRCAERPTDWPASGPTVATLAELRDRVCRSVYAEHLEPLFARILATTGVSANLLWTNAAEWLGMVSDAAEEYLDPLSAHPYVEDRRALFAAEDLAGFEGRNPLHGRLVWDPADAPDLPSGVQVRQVCCITYLLPDRLGRLCQNCPFLPLEDRIALIRERHGVPIGTASGPAELRAIEVGLEKIRSKA